MSCLRHKVCRMLNLNHKMLKFFLEINITYNSKIDNDNNNDVRRSFKPIRSTLLGYHEGIVRRFCQKTGVFNRHN